MLDDLRAMGPTHLLTTATLDYTQAVNQEFDLGFEDDSIFTRERFIDPNADFPTMRNFCPDSILVDNAVPKYIYARIKREFLGIGESRYFQVRTLNGKAPPQFKGEWAEVVGHISNPCNDTVSCWSKRQAI